MNDVDIARLLEPGDGPCQDRLEVVRLGDSVVLVLADGAGGMGGGARAAELAVSLALAEAERVADERGWSAALSRIDAAIAMDRQAGETTCVVAVLAAGRVMGASVGDSGAWWVDRVRVADLTEGQVRKPLLGSGSSRPTAFRLAASSGALLVASDGLWKYAPSPRIAEAVRRPVEATAVAQALVGLARLRSGALPDDVAIGLVRRS